MIDLSAEDVRTMLEEVTSPKNWRVPSNERIADLCRSWLALEARLVEMQRKLLQGEIKGDALQSRTCAGCQFYGLRGSHTIRTGNVRLMCMDNGGYWRPTESCSRWQPRATTGEEI